MGATTIMTPTLVVPAGTTQAAPATTSLYPNRAYIVKFSILIPPGPSGFVGFQLWHSSAQIIPDTVGTWIVADDEVITWELDDLQPWPNWSLHAYNSDFYDHTLYPRLYLDDRVPTSTVPLTLLPIQ